MKYIIERASIYGNSKAPCEEAFKAPHEIWHLRTCSEDVFNEKFSHREGLWRDKGRNHTVTDKGYIKRQEDDAMLWTVEFITLEELTSFIEKYEEVIISAKSGNSISPRIIIYDDYVE